MSHARLVLELGASLARLRRDYDRALDRIDVLEQHIDVLEQHLAAARAALNFWRAHAATLGYDAPLPDEPLCDQA